MKDFVIRLFLLVCALVFIIESAVFFVVRFRPVSLEEAIVFYRSLLLIDGSQGLTLGLAIGFLITGLIFLYLNFRIKVQPNFVTVKDKTGILHIPLETIRDFVDQTLGMLDKYSFVGDFTTTVQKKGKWIYINILSTCASTVSICQEIHRLREALREQTMRIFGLPNLKIVFQIKGISVEQKRKEIVLQQEQEESKNPLLKEDLLPQKESKQDFEGITEGALQKEKHHKIMPWEQ